MTGTGKADAVKSSANICGFGVVFTVMIVKDWEELELFAEQASSAELETVVCPNCGALIEIQRASSNKTIRISCKPCGEETVICVVPTNK